MYVSHLDRSAVVTLLTLEHFGSARLWCIGVLCVGWCGGGSHAGSRGLVPREVVWWVVTMEILYVSLEASFSTRCVVTVRTAMLKVSVHMSIEEILGVACNHR